MPQGAASAPGHGLLVAFEGIDGSGKSTAVRHVAAALERRGFPVVATREETSGPTGEWVRRSIAERWDPVATAFLFAADRARHTQELRAWLAQGKVVLCDRYIHSTLAYQGVTLRGHVPDPAAFLQRMHEGWAILPDHVLLFRADAARSVERTERRGSTTPYEKVAFLAEVQKGYDTLAATDARVTPIDAERPIGELCRDAEEHVLRWAAARGIRGAS